MFISAAVCPIAQGAVDPSEDNSVVYVRDILTKIQNGEKVEYDNVTIIGDLNFNELGISTIPLNEPLLVPIPKINRFSKKDPISKGTFYTELENVTLVRSPIIISNSIIKGSVEFRGIRLLEPINLAGSKFLGDADFSGTTFNGANFFGATFYKYVFFDGTTFDCDVDFGQAIFKENAYFLNSKFNGISLFDGATFSGIADFSQAEFNSNTSYFIAMWRRTTATGRRIGIGNPDSHLVQDVKSQLTAKLDASFVNSTFNMDVYFDETTFSGIADFDGSKFKGYFFGWTYIKNNIICDEATYLGLIKTLKDHGQFDDADDCYYTYRFNNMRNIYDIVSWLSCGFGVSWPQTIYFGVFWLVFFGCVYFLMSLHRNSNKTSLMQQLTASIWFSAVVLLSIPSDLYPQRAGKYKEYANQIKYHLPILERLIGWGLLVLFINTLSRVMIRY